MPKQQIIKFEKFPEEVAAWRPPEDLTVSEWVEKHRIIKGPTPEPGPWRNSRTPYLIDPMDCFGLDIIEHLVLCFGTQLGKTEFEYNCLFYTIDQDPGYALFVYPTDKLAKSISKNRIQPNIEACDVLRDLKSEKPTDFATLEMIMKTMTLNLGGANSPATLASRPCRYLFRDEVAKFPKYCGDEGSPLDLSEERTKNFWNRKIVDVSSPKRKEDNIWEGLRTCDAIFQYFIQCPHCGEYQRFEFNQIKWPKGEKVPAKVRDLAWYECIHCGEGIDDLYKPEMLAGGEWRRVHMNDQGTKLIAKNSTGGEELFAAIERGTIRKVGFHLNSIYSPWVTFGRVAEQFLKSRPYPEKFQNFINSWLDEPWVDRVIEKKESDILKLCLEYPPLVVPSEKIIALTAGIDKQKHGYYFVVRGWARDYESWLIHYGFLPSDEALRALIFDNVYQVQGTDRLMSIWRGGIDIGGTDDESGISMTQQVYSWVRKYGRGVVWCVKGASRPFGSRLKYSIKDKMPGRQGVPIPGGIVLWSVNTAEFKDVIHYRMQVKPGDLEGFHLHSETGEDYAKQIVAEEKQRDNKTGIYSWVQVANDNHYLDCEVYAAAMADPEFQGGVAVLRDPTVGPKKPKPEQEKPSNWQQRGYKRPNWLNRR